MFNLLTFGVEPSDWIDWMAIACIYMLIILFVVVIWGLSADYVFHKTHTCVQLGQVYYRPGSMVGKVYVQGGFVQDCLKWVSNK